MNVIDECIKGLTDIESLSCSEKAVSQSQLDAITSRLLSSKFRKTKIDDLEHDNIIRILRGHISNETPLKLSVPFGAYKGWKLPTYPGADWAEVFNIRHMINYLAPIAMTYPRGVTVYYTYQDSIMSEISNVSTKDLEEYKRSFSALLAFFNGKLMKSGIALRFEMFAINSLYDTPEEFYNDYEEGYRYNLGAWTTKYSASEREKKVQSARNNLTRKGLHDYTSLTDAEWEAKCVESAMRTDAVDCLQWRRKFNKGEDKIQLVFVRGPTMSIHIGSCRTSTAHFWAGTGVLETKQKTPIPRILTQQNFLELLAQGELHNRSVNTVLSDISDNYKSIYYKNN